MFLDKAELRRDKPLKGLPVSCVLLPVLLTKAEEQVSRIGLVSGLPKVPVRDDGSLWKRFVNHCFKAIPPFTFVVNFLLREAHMSGLLGLFVWKQKATTDAPDTLFNCNTKSQAKKNHRAMVVSSTAQNVKLCEANHADI